MVNSLASVGNLDAESGQSSGQSVVNGLAICTKQEPRRLISEPAAPDAALVATGAKGQLGPLACNTVAHRLAVLGQWHSLRHWPNSSKDPAVVMLVKKARVAQVRRGVKVRKKTAAVRESLEAMLSTCTDGASRRTRSCVALGGLVQWWTATLGSDRT